MVCYVVLGCFRGGTSAVAGLLRLFGIDMGDKRYYKITSEDEEFIKFHKDGDWEGFEKFVNELDSKKSVWGYKYPGSKDDFDKIHKLLKSPKYILVYRDPEAIIRSEVNRNGNDYASTISFVNSQLQKMFEIHERLIEENVEHVVISYEKLLFEKQKEIEKLAKFCNYEGSLDKAFSFVKRTGYDEKYNNPAEFM